MPPADTTDQLIPCPQCGHAIPITDALTKEIERRTKEKWEQEFRRQEADLAWRTGEIAQREKDIESAQRQITEQVEERVRARETELLTTAQQRAEKALALEMADLKKANQEQAERLQEAQQEELKLGFEAQWNGKPL